jgi:putative cardiolipin synthase
MTFLRTLRAVRSRSFSSRRCPGHGNDTLVTGARACPRWKGAPKHFAVTDSQATRLGRAIAARAASHHWQKGCLSAPTGQRCVRGNGWPLRAPPEVLDLQYYIWPASDGYLLLEQVWRRGAARCPRPLSCSTTRTGRPSTETIAALDAHPRTLEVRLYTRCLATDNARGCSTHHGLHEGEPFRMQINVHGRNRRRRGRTQHRERKYFGAGSGVEFEDLVSSWSVRPYATCRASSVLYWNSASAYPATHFVGPPAPMRPPA